MSEIENNQPEEIKEYIPPVFNKLGEITYNKNGTPRKHKIGDYYDNRYAVNKCSECSEYYSKDTTYLRTNKSSHLKTKKHIWAINYVKLLTNDLLC